MGDPTAAPLDPVVYAAMGALTLEELQDAVGPPLAQAFGAERAELAPDGAIVLTGVRRDDPDLLARATAALAPALERCRRHDAERAVHRRDRVAVEQLRRVHDVTDAALAHL